MEKARERPFHCEICGKSFAFKSGLNSHLECHSTERPFKCHICGKACKVKSSLGVHLRTHKDRNFMCNLCLQTFISKKDFEVHFQIHSGEDPYRCPFCELTFCHLKIHMRIHEENNRIPLREDDLYSEIKSVQQYHKCDQSHQEENGTLFIKDEKKMSYVCDICKKDFAERSDYIDHLEKPTDLKSITNDVSCDESFPCRICHEVCTSKSGLKEHVRCHFVEFFKEGFFEKSDFPEKDFEETENFIDHIICNSEEKSVSNNVCHKTVENKAHKGKRYVCHTCEKKFVHRRSLKWHFCTHSRPYKCEICQKSYSKKSLLRKHSVIHTQRKKNTKKKKEKKFVCSVCFETFSAKTEKDFHIRTHYRKKDYKCVVCAIDFTRRSDLKDHFLIHLGEIPLKCEVCGLTFSRKTDFYYHLSSHNTEKRFKCDKCEITFARKTDFYYHLSSHNTKKRFKCDKCGKGYQFKRSFMKHLRTHGDNFVCSVCEKAFLTQQHLKVHFRKHSQENPYECPFCGKPCYQNDYLERHMQSHIQVNPLSSIKEEKTMTE